MPQHKSAEKRMRTNEKRRRRNRAVKSEVRQATKAARAALGTKEAGETLRQVHSVLDNAAKKGILHWKTASRRKGRLAKAVAKASGKSDAK